MRRRTAILAAGLALAAATSPAIAAPEQAKWVAELPRRMWIIEVGPESRAIPCSPEICQAALNEPPYRVLVRYTNSPSGRKLLLSASVRGCSRAFRRRLALDGLDRSLWQARYEQLFAEMNSAFRNGCVVALPVRLTPIPIDRLILAEDR